LSTDKSYKDFIDCSEVIEKQIDYLKVHRDSYATISWRELYEYDFDLANDLFYKPKNILPILDTAFQSRADLLGLADFNKPLHIVDLPEERVKPIREISYRSIGELISISGIIIQRSAVQQRMTYSKYICLECETEFGIEQVMQFTRKPQKCSNTICGAGSSSFMLLPDECKYVKSQRIKIQENSDEVPSGVMPETFTVEFKEHLCDSVKPGMRVTISGVLCGEERKKGDTAPVINLFIEANHIDDLDDSDMNVEVLPEDIDFFNKQVNKPNYLSRLKKSFAPQLHQLEAEKLAIILQQCEGVTKNVYGVRIRGQFHILIVGDAGEGKTVLLSSAKNLHPRGVTVTGKGGTAAGLTAAVVQDADTKEWTLRAGAMVLADRGILCADELDKMSGNDRSAMHPAMASQEIPINKAGINATLNTRCSVLGACNPKLGQWSDYKSIRENIDMPLPLIDRFGVIFVLKNQRTINEEMERVDYVLNLRAGKLSDPPFTLEQLRKLLSYARTFTPNLSDESIDALKDFYRKMTTSSKNSNGIPLSMRTLEDLIRLTEASAKLHLRDVTTIGDARVAIDIIRTSLMQYSVDPETGEIDTGILRTGVPQSLREKLEKLLTVVSELQKSSITGDMVSADALGDYLRDNWNMKDEEVGKLLSIASREGVIIHPRPGFWKVT